MTLPVPVRTFQFVTNQVWGSVATELADGRDLMLKIKGALINAGVFTAEWTVWGSCDGSGGAGSFGNGDSVDRWDAVAKLVWAAAASNHSWIVLVQTGLGAKTAICIDLSNANPYNCTVVLSPSAGFGLANGGADGTATARPTASDELVLVSNAAWGLLSAAGSTGKLTVAISTDGKSNRVLIQRAGFVSGIWLLEAPSATVRADWAAPVWGWAWGTNSAPSDPGNISYGTLGSTTAGIKLRLGAAAASACFTGEAVGSNKLGQEMTFADEYTSEWPMPAIGMYCYTVGSRGRLGEVVDIRWSSTTRVTGDDYPAAGTHLWWQVGDLCLPGSGVALILT